MLKKFRIGLALLPLALFPLTLMAMDTTITVTANPLWTNTGIILEPGQSVTIHNAAAVAPLIPAPRVLSSSGWDSMTIVSQVMFPTMPGV
jgi:hypothetical protein